MTGPDDGLGCDATDLVDQHPTRWSPECGQDRGTALGGQVSAVRCQRVSGL
jgi:hypothetical protein